MIVKKSCVIRKTEGEIFISIIAAGLSTNSKPFAIEINSENNKDIQPTLSSLKKILIIQFITPKIVTRIAHIAHLPNQLILSILATYYAAHNNRAKGNMNLLQKPFFDAEHYR